MEREDFLVPGEVSEFSIRLGPTACRFGEGHVIRLEITSSDFPNFDRNHNTGGNDLFETDMVPAEQKIYHTETERSRLILGVGG
jgi:predicted acyl esterase